MKKVYYVGIDLATAGCEVAVVDREGKVVEKRRVTTSEHDLIEAVKPWGPNVEVAVEQGELAGWACRSLAPYVRRVVVADPKCNAWIARDPNKGDSIDAEKLAQLLRGGFLREVYQPQEDDRAEFKKAVQHYEAMTYREAVLKVQIKSELRQVGVLRGAQDAFRDERRQALLQRVTSEAIRQIVTDLCEALDSTLELQERARNRMIELGRKYPEVARLQTMPGVGPIVSSRYVAYIQTPTRFSNKRKLWRYSRLGISNPETGGKPLGREHLDRSGNGSLKDVSRKAFEGAMRCRDDNGIKRAYHQSLERTGNKTHARLSTQRKILSILRAMWRDGTEYKDNGLNSEERTAR